MDLPFSKKQFLIVALICFAPFAAYLALPRMIGADSYFFLDGICHGASLDNQPPLSIFAFSLLPCNLIVLKLVLYALFLASVVFLVLLVGLFVKRNAWRAGVLAMSIPVLSMEFFKLENDQFAYPLLFAALYFYYRREKFDVWIAIALVAVAGLFWEGAAYIAFALALGCLEFLVLAAPILINYYDSFVTYIVPDLAVAENMFGKTMPLLFLGFIGVFKIPKRVLPQFVFLFFIGMINAKFLILSVPFFLIGLTGVLEGEDKLKWKFGKWIYYAVIMMVIAQSITVLRSPMPSDSQVAAVKYVVELGGGQVQNDWDYGHWVVFYGGDTNSRFHHSWKREWHEGVVLTRKGAPGCELRKDFGDVNVYWCDAIRISVDVTGGEGEGVLVPFEDSEFG